MALLVGVELLFRAYLVVDGPLGQRIATYREVNAPELDPGVTVAPHPYWVYNMSPRLGRINRFGFSFDDLPLEKAPGVRRIVCIGASTTAGPRAWPWHLQEELRRSDPRVEVLNFGVQGWTSAESLVAFALLGQHFAPDVVVVHHANNDLAPMRSQGFRPDYAHYRKPLGMTEGEMGALRIKTDLGWFVDSSLTRMSSIYVYAQLWIVGDETHRYTLNYLSERRVELGPTEDDSAFKANLRSIAALSEAAGADFVVTTMPHRKEGAELWGEGLDRQNQRLVELSAEEGWTLIPLHEQSWDEAWFEDSVHLDQAGQAEKAGRIAAGLPR